MKKADFIVIGVVLGLAVIIIGILYGFNSTGNYVQIEINGKIAETVPLNEDTTLPIMTDYGENTLVIKDGSAVMTYADCPDGICTNHKPINKSGESIICLPHKVVVSIINEKTNDNQIDAVA